MSELGVTYRGAVYPWQCDHMGHMNVMWYVGKFDEATWQLLAAIGLARARLERDGGGMAAVEQHIEYKRELRPGDIVTIRSAILEVKDKSIRFRHEMKNDETSEVSAITVIVGVHLDTGMRKARSLPQDVRSRATALCNTSSGIASRDCKAAELVQTISPESETKLGTAFASIPQHAAMLLGPCW
jgi:acyl-CoA thioester hydrolase